MFDGASIQKERIMQAFKCLPPEISGLLSLMDRQKHYQGNPDGGIPAMTHFVKRRKVPRGMLKAISHWFSGNDAMRESRPEWGEYYATLTDIRGGEMRVSLRVEGDEGGGGVEVLVDVEIIHNVDDGIPNSDRH
ncbi:hypothetical protein DSLASN_29920 [Desulfoluna limicola]|uniref:Uncharacterized protein n=1 Tax=Desulfoluna limicola TaxID=2810562 RepID=A0ABM7PJC6_9BACT|nr:hypothetical protein [Desulfoluna limicola]BCS97360.1 hypothetical protein DSLASN_29920 [Desulfoluna limicola]